MREEIEFDAEGATLRGWFYRPDATEGTEVPCVVMSHGFSAIKEMHLDEYAEVFCAAGLSCVVYDNRGFGASDAATGQPRRRSTRGSRSAITSTPSPTCSYAPTSTRIASVSGGQATPVRTRTWWQPSTAA